MGITERHWFEDEEPELTDRQLEDAVYDDKKIVRCKDCKYWNVAKMDMEKVIRIIDELIFEAQKEPTWKAENALQCLKKELLKEQETEWEKIWEAPDGTYKGRCKRCGYVHIFIECHDSQYNFCPSCGRSVK